MWSCFVMERRNLRSLLLAVIVLSSCITWVAMDLIDFKCTQRAIDCEQIQRTYGLQETVFGNDCEGIDEPCAGKNCPEGEQCVPNPYYDTITNEVRYRFACNIVIPQAPLGNQEVEAEVAQASLRRLFHSNPRPKITWRGGQIVIKRDSNDKLEIATMYNSGRGICACIAEQQFNVTAGTSVIKNTEFTQSAETKKTEIITVMSIGTSELSKIIISDVIASFAKKSTVPVKIELTEEIDIYGTETTKKNIAIIGPIVTELTKSNAEFTETTASSESKITELKTEDIDTTDLTISEINELKPEETETTVREPTASTVTDTTESSAPIVNEITESTEPTNSATSTKPNPSATSVFEDIETKKMSIPSPVKPKSTEEFVLTSSFNNMLSRASNNSGSEPADQKTTEMSTSSRTSSGISTPEGRPAFEFRYFPGNETEATGPNGAGCSCATLEFGCCPDRVTPENNTMEPDCSAYESACAALRCEFGVQRARTASGCERCSCVQPEVDCTQLTKDCEQLKCNYGLKKTVGADGCERCSCLDHHCTGKYCPEGERCVPNPSYDGINNEVHYSVDCRVVNKPGACPAEAGGVGGASCRRDCNDDADCRGVRKCCRSGCSQLCLLPQDTTTPPINTIAPPNIPQAPTVNKETEPEIAAQEGGKASLRCIFHRNPPPKITWRRGEGVIDGDKDRYRLLSDGTLEIVALYRSDAGVYICVADNGLGIAEQQINLIVKDPVQSPASIAGDQDAVVEAEMGRSVMLRCFAYGFPPPHVGWYRGLHGPMVPFSSKQYEARDNWLLVRELNAETLGEYACEAYNGVGNSASLRVTLRARIPQSNAVVHPPVPDQMLVTRPPRVPAPLPFTTLPPLPETPAPDNQVPPYTVPVSTSLTAKRTTLGVGSELSLRCDVDGYPVPNVRWTKDGNALVATERMHLTDARLRLADVYEQDSGTYGCHARNEYSSHYSTIQITVQENNTVEPDCSAYESACAALRCEFGVHRARTASGCERCSCVQPEVDCTQLTKDCEQLKCNYGLKKTVGADGCERCSCLDHHCTGKYCPEGERCVPNPSYDGINNEVHYSVDCRVVNKPGACPAEAGGVGGASCRRDCNDDADCRGVRKCCRSGCSQLCLLPQDTTTPPINTIAPPNIPQAPTVNKETEPEIAAQEGGKASLRCLFHRNPPPKITWRRGEGVIDGDKDRYRLLSDGTLEIVALYRSDAGVYICVADNGLGIAEQQINLIVKDPVQSPASIAGDQDAVVEAEMGRSVMLRCFAYGFPPPHVGWYRGLHGPMVPFSSKQYEARDNWLLVRELNAETLGEYACEAYNGVGNSASLRVTLRARIPQSNAVVHPPVPDQMLVTRPPRVPAPLPFTTLPPLPETPAPDNQVPPYTVPVSTSLTAKRTTLGVGSELSLRCDVDGYPVPNVRWTKDGNALVATERMHLTDARLRLADVYEQDSGTYGCHARNEYSSHYSTIQITVQENNTVEPDCSAYESACAALRCEFGVHRARTASGCERCSCVQPEVDCTQLTKDCEQLKCNYGLKKTVGADGCERCSCLNHPCTGKYCPEGERCVPNPSYDGINNEVHYSVDCRVVNKPGACPAEAGGVGGASCRRDCNDDADCRGVRKCCRSGCSQLCLLPQDTTTPPINTIAPPNIPQAPTVNKETEPEIAAQEGGKASLRCLFHRNPPPKITWRRGEGVIDGDKDRYRLLSDGTLEIVALYRSDAGVYICVADNGLGIAEQQINLIVKVPVSTSLTAKRTTLGVGSELSLRCDVDGYPVPNVRWTKDGNALVATERMHLTDARLRLADVYEQDSGTYGCHARNEYSSHYSTIQITVQGLHIPAYCTDNPLFANCVLIVRSKFCTHKYYSPFCCKSCAEAGQLDPRELQLQADTPWRK